MKKLFFIAFIVILVAFGLGVGSGIGNQLKGKIDSAKQVLPAKDTENNAAQNSQQVQEEAVAVPTAISIPKINVTASLESVGQDANGAMDVPKDSDNGAWYNLGTKPGEKGNAVIAGHFDKVDGSPAVFWNLSKLTTGDEIVITDADGQTKSFEVIRTENFPYNNFPMQEVFGESSEKMLNLITCEGSWNSATGMYSHRTVVFSRLVE